MPDNGPEAENRQKISALDHYQAAEVWAKWSDRNSVEYPIANGEAVTLMVRNLDDRSLFAIRVTGEAVPQYSAHDADYSA